MIKKLLLEKADRLYHLPPLVDDFLPRKTHRKMLGRDIFDLARLNWPTLPPDQAPEGSMRPASAGNILSLAEKTAEWYRNRYGGRVNPAREIFIGGSIRGILNLLALAYLNPGDLVLAPDPGVWHYRTAAVLASAETIPYHLSERHQFKPALSSISGNVARTARAMILNSPHNPSGAVLSKDNLSEILLLARRENMLLILDQAFDGLVEGEAPASLYSLPGGRRTAVELYSYAYNFGQPRPSCAFAVGQPAIIAALTRLAAAFGFALSEYQVNTALAACESPMSALDNLKRKCANNRSHLDRLCEKLRLIPPEHRVGPFYWAKLPGRRQSRRFCRLIYLKAGILALPGDAFGENGEGFVRFSLMGETAVYSRVVESTRKLFSPARKRDAAHG
jgi:LL-diaminopimelate aminotransferase